MKSWPYARLGHSPAPPSGPVHRCVGIVLCLVVYLLNERIIPESYDAQTRILQETGSQNPSAMLEAGSFINAFDKYVIFIYRMEGDRLYGVQDLSDRHPTNPPVPSLPSKVSLSMSRARTS